MRICVPGVPPWLLGSTERQVSPQRTAVHRRGRGVDSPLIQFGFYPIFGSLNAWVTSHKPPINHLWSQLGKYYSTYMKDALKFNQLILIPTICPDSSIKVHMPILIVLKRSPVCLFICFFKGVQFPFPKHLRFFLVFVEFLPC